MAQTCSRCSRTNPADAAYCYFDGSLLDGHSRSATLPAETFPMPFIFPSGLACRSFDDLALGCLDNWAVAVDFLQQGVLERFLGGLGRGDLVMAARVAANFPDTERGLDQLLSRLPTKNVVAPKMKAPGEVNLAPLQVGDQRQFELRIGNQGGRLLYGSVVSDCKWLTLGDGPGNTQKLFQSRGETSVPVRIRGEHLRAGNKPLEGRLLLESNGGTMTVLIRLRVPVQPFVGGVLSGAQTPRQLADNAKQAPKEAAPFFESGAVAKWYEANGWTYPVLGPAATGGAAVQQFFEAVGLVRPPKVEISERAVHLQGTTGERLQCSLQVRNSEKRPIFAQAGSDQPWLTVGPVQSTGTAAIIPLEVASVPGSTGQVLQARVVVTANGNQRFVVPVSLAVAPTAAAAAALPVADLTLSPAVAVAAMPPMPVAAMLPTERMPPVRKADPEADRFAVPPSGGGWPQPPKGGTTNNGPFVVPALAGQTPPPPQGGTTNNGPFVVPPLGGQTPPPPKGGTTNKGPFVVPALAGQTPQPAKTGTTNSDPFVVPALAGQTPQPPKGGTTNSDPFVVPALAGQTPQPAKAGTTNGQLGRRQRLSPLVHLAPLALLMLALFGVAVGDILTEAPPATQVAVGDDPTEEQAPQATAPPPPVVKIEDEPDERTEAVAPPVQYEIKDEPEVRELVMLPVTVDIKDEPQQGGDPGPEIGIDPRPRLNIQYSRSGRFGVSVADTGKQLTYAPDGSTNTCVVHIDGKTGEFGSAGVRESLTRLQGGQGGRALWHFAKLEFTQTLELVPSKQPVEIAPGVQKRLLDTVLVRYHVRNQDTRAHTVGLRLQLDTLIGGNDGVPFTVPGLPGLVTTSHDFFTANRVPDFIQALEVADLRHPGTVAHLTLKVGGKLEPPGRVSLTHWPGRNTAWNVPVTAMGSDSAAVLYWNPRQLAPGKVREFGFAYGLGGVSSGEAAGRLGITLGGGFEPGQVFNVTAYVTNPSVGQTLTLELPDGLERLDSEQTQAVQPAVGAESTRTVTWKVKVLQTGVFPLRVRSSNGLAQTKTITIARPEGPSGGNVMLQLAGSFEPGKVFEVTAKVSSPVEGQTLTLKLPAGLSRAAGAEVEHVPAPVAGVSTVAWKVQVDEVGKFPVRVQSSTGVVQTKTITIVRQDQNAGKVALSLAGDIAPGKVFTLIAKVANPVRGQRLTLALAPGLQRIEGPDVQQVPSAEAGSSTILWKVKLNEAGEHFVSVQSTTGVTLKKTIKVEKVDDKAGRFDLKLTGDIGLKKDFMVTANVTNPVPGQRLTLTVPKGMELKEGAEVQAVPALPEGARQGISSIRWTLYVQELARFPLRVESTTGVARTKTLTIRGADGTGQLFGR